MGPVRLDRLGSRVYICSNYIREVVIMSLLDEIGLAVRDGVYEVFFQYTDTTDLQELKESEYDVKELAIGNNGWDKLYYLVKGNTLQCSCSLVVRPIGGRMTPEVKVHNSMETMELLRYFKNNGAARAESARASKGKGEI